MNPIDDAQRYKTVRGMVPDQFKELVLKVLFDVPPEKDYEEAFDDLVDEIINKDVEQPKGRGTPKRRKVAK